VPWNLSEEKTDVNIQLKTKTRISD